MGNNNGSGCSGCIVWSLLIILGLVLAFTSILFAPGVIIAAIVDSIFQLGQKPLWGVTILSSVIVAIICYNISEYNKWKTYIILSLVLAFGIFIFYLFKEDNFIVDTLLKMYDSEVSNVVLDSKVDSIVLEPEVNSISPESDVRIFVPESEVSNITPELEVSDVDSEIDRTSTTLETSESEVVSETDTIDTE